jgi:hypothetical protein
MLVSPVYPSRLVRTISRLSVSVEISLVYLSRLVRISPVYLSVNPYIFRLFISGDTYISSLSCFRWYGYLPFIYIGWCLSCICRCRYDCLPFICLNWTPVSIYGYAVICLLWFIGRNFRETYIRNLQVLKNKVSVHRPPWLLFCRQTALVLLSCPGTCCDSSLA